MSYGYNSYQPPYKPMYGQPQYQSGPYQPPQPAAQPAPVQPMPQQWQPIEQPAPAAPAAPVAPVELQEAPEPPQEMAGYQELAKAINRLSDLAEALYSDYRKEIQKVWTSDR